MLIYLYIILICYLPIVDDFMPKLDFGKGIPDIGPLRIGSLLLFLLFIIHAAIKKDVKVLNAWFGLLVVFYFIEFTSILWSVYSYNSSTLQYIYNSAFIPFFLALLAMNLFNKEEIAHTYIKHVTIAAFIMSVISIVQMILNVVTGSSDFRASGTLGNPNLLAVTLVLALPCTIYAAEKKMVSNLFGKIAGICIVLGVVFTVSRKGIVTMILCYMLYYYLFRKYRKMITILVSFVVLAILLSGYTLVTQRFEKGQLVQQLSEKWRMTTIGWEMFKTSPIQGLGYKGYYEHFGIFNPNTRHDKYDAHNIYITALANYGLLGFIPFVSIFLYPLIRSRKVLKDKPDPVQNSHISDMATICMTSIVPFMISGWFAGNLFYNPQPMSLLYANILLFLALNRERKTSVLS